VIKDSRLRVLFLTLYPETMPSSRLRVYQYLPYLEEFGIEATVCPAVPEPLFSRLYYSSSKWMYLLYYAAEIPANIGRIFKSRRFDLVFIQKGILSMNLRGFDRLLEWANPRFVFDLDDAVFGKNIVELPWLLSGVFQDIDQTKKISSRAQAVIVGNNYLRELALEHNKNVSLIPTPVDTNRFCRQGRRQEKGEREIVIGWIGLGGTFTVHFLPILEVLRKVAHRYPIRLKIITRPGKDGLALENVPFDLVPWSYDTEVAEMEDFDIGIMPLPNDEWARGKCGLKLLQYMSMGIPSVASNVGMNSEIIDEGIDGFLASTPAEWTEKLSRLIEDAGLRARMGEAARVKVVENYSLEKMAPRFAEVLEQAGSYETIHAS